MGFDDDGVVYGLVRLCLFCQHLARSRGRFRWIAADRREDCSYNHALYNPVQHACQQGTRCHTSLASSDCH